MYYFTHFSAGSALSAPRWCPRTEPPGRPGGCFVRHFSAFFENEGNPAQKKKFIGIGTGLVVSVHRARAGCDHDLLFVVASRRGGAAAVGGTGRTGDIKIGSALIRGSFLGASKREAGH